MRLLAVFALLGFARASNATVEGEGAEFFSTKIQPLLKEYCLNCHSTEKQKGDLDLEAFATIDSVEKHPKTWQTVAEQLANKEMPPKNKPQPTAGEMERLSDWVTSTLNVIARARAGDPGPVVLRRLSNAEYTYTVRDLTGIDSLEPAREFPVDGAAGEGFTNTGQALVMSPSLITKYLDAAKEITRRAVLLPGDVRFSVKTTRRDWTDEIVAQIRALYGQFTDSQGGEKRVLQGIAMDRTNEGGRLPLERYFAAALEEREALANGTKTVEAVAREHGLSAKYLETLLSALSGTQRSLLLDALRARWRNAIPADAAALTAEIAQWQKALWKFNSVGHIGKVGGPKAWMEPVNPLAPQQDVRLKLAESTDGRDVTFYLVASGAGDGSENDFVLWEKPRLVAPGSPDLLLRDVRELSRLQTQRRTQICATAAKCLDASMEASAAQAERVDVNELAQRHDVDPAILRLWLDYLGIGSAVSATIDSYLTGKIMSVDGFDFIRGWGVAETPYLVANSSDQQVRIPGNMKGHGIAVHPSPKLRVAVGWRSPLTAKMHVETAVTHAHPDCGNGVVWSLELRRGSTRQRLAAGTAQGSNEVKVAPIDGLCVQPGDLVTLLIGPRDGNHECDLTAVNLVLTSSDKGMRTWDLGADISPDVLAGNPHADRFGNEGVWHFYTEPDNGTTGPDSVIPPGSLLSEWLMATNEEEKRELAGEVQNLMLSGQPGDRESPNTKLRQQLASLGAPVVVPMTNTASASVVDQSSLTAAGPDPAQFGRHPNGQPIEPASICVQAPSVLEIRVPAELAAGRELVTTGRLEPVTGTEGSVQLRVLTTKPEAVSGLLPSSASVAVGKGAWTDNNQMVSISVPIIVNDGSTSRQRFEDAFEAFRELFPAALCYTKIVPVDEVVTLTLFHREDEHLMRLMLDDTQRERLDRLWDELHYVSQDPLTLVDALAQIIEFSTQDGDPKVFTPLRQPFNERAAAFRQRLIDTEPRHLDAVLEFADRAYRRPLTDGEKGELRQLYAKLRAQELPHDDAIRLTLARVLVSPAFLYRAESPGPGLQQVPINDWELANRLSYFLWSSMPDPELRASASAGALRHPEILLAQTQRMLRDPQVRRLAIEFACQWLHIHDFEALDEKSERHFPTFVALRGAMYEESIRFFTDFFQRDGSILGILDADHAFLNEALAKHYGIPGVTGDDWRRVEGVRKFSRGGILGQAATLAKQSGASRTSPILRGNWVAEVLLGDKLPRPPKDVPRLPEDEVTETLTVRQLTEKHSTDPRCYNCHKRIDAFGFALEGFDAIGRLRDRDMADRPIDTRAKVMDGTDIEGVDGLRDYLLTKRRDVFVRQFCRKLLGYALGRAVQLSDEPLLTEMQAVLKTQDYRVGAAIGMIVQSRQFREIRGREMTYEE